MTKTQLPREKNSLVNDHLYTFPGKLPSSILNDTLDTYVGDGFSEKKIIVIALKGSFVNFTLKLKLVVKKILFISLLSISCSLP